MGLVKKYGPFFSVVSHKLLANAYEYSHDGICHFTGLCISH